MLVRNTTDFQRLEAGGPALGVFRGARYQYGEVMIRPGDLLVISSDGIVEATDADEEEFGEKRLISVIAQNRRRTPAEICSHILASVDAFLRGRAAEDDRTLVIARLQPIQTERIPAAEVELSMSLGVER